MIEIDFHGYSLDEAKTYLEKLINTHYLNKEIISYKLIVGHGIIKTHFLEMLKNYDCEAAIELGNTGVIIAHIGIEDY